MLTGKLKEFTYQAAKDGKVKKSGTVEAVDSADAKRILAGKFQGHFIAVQYGGTL